MNLPANEKKQYEWLLQAINDAHLVVMPLQAGTSLVLKWSANDQLKRKRHAEEVQSERENRKIDAHMALANKVYAIR